MEIIWKPLIYNNINYSDRFEISNTGMLRNIISKKIYKLSISDRGYYQVVVSIGSRTSKLKVKIHMAVAQNFIENTENRLEVNHKNGNKLDNNDYNLEWSTRSENMKHANRSNLLTYRKLIDEDIDYIRKNYVKRSKNNNTVTFAKMFNVHHDTISSVVNNETHK